MRELRIIGLAFAVGCGVAEAVCAQQAQARGTLTLQQVLETTLRLHPQIGVQQQEVGIQQGIRRQLSGSFDPVYQSGLQQSYTPVPVTLPGAGAANSAVNVTTFSAGATRLYRSGVTAGPAVALTRTRDNIFNPEGISQSRLAYEVTVPLRRNQGRQVAAQERSATIDIDASQYELNQTISSLLADAAGNYWRLVGALRLLEVAGGSEQRGQLFLSTTQSLVDADRIPRNDLSLVRANLAQRIAARLQAQQDAVEARQALALALGLSPEEMQQVPDPSEDLPEISGAAPVADAPTVRAYIELALTRRADYLAAKRRVESARALLPAAENQTRPGIDLTFSSGYSGLRVGAAPTSALAALFRGASGMDAVAGVRYEFAPANNAAQGRLSQTQAALRQAELRATDTARSIAATVTVAVMGLHNAAQRLERARESVAAFQSALAAEREKYTLGFGSLVDILTTEDRLTGALGVEVRARVDYALELARLRQATGTVIEPLGEPRQVDPLEFRTAPVMAAGGAQ